MLKAVLWIGAVIVVPGLGIALLAKKLFKEIDDFEKLRSRHEHDTRNV